jgi:hypothetical protein
MLVNSWGTISKMNVSRNAKIPIQHSNFQRFSLGGHSPQFSSRWVLDRSCLKGKNNSLQQPQLSPTNPLSLKLKESNEKASPIRGSFKLFAHLYAVIGSMVFLGSLGMSSHTGTKRSFVHYNLQNLNQKLIEHTEKLPKVEERQEKYLRQELTSLQQEIRKAENTQRSLKLETVALHFVTLISVLSYMAMVNAVLHDHRGRLYLSNDQKWDEIQNTFQKNVLTLAIKRQEILEKCPELKGFLSELYGNNLPSSVEGHAKQLEDAFALELYSKLVPNEHDRFIEARDYYLMLNEKTFEIQDSTAYFPEIELLNKLGSQLLESGSAGIQKSFRPLLDSIHSNQTTFEDGVHQLQNALKDVEPSLLILQSQWVESILKERSHEEGVKHQKTEMNRVTTSLQEKSALILELETQCENFNKKIGNPKDERSLKGSNPIDENVLRLSESEIEPYYQAKKSLVQTQLDVAKLQVEKFSLEQKYHGTFLKWTAAQQSTYNAHQAFKALSLETSEMIQLHQQLRQLVEMKQQFPETDRRHSSWDVSPLQQLLEKEQRNPILEAVERKSQEAFIGGAGEGAGGHTGENFVKKS